MSKMQVVASPMSASMARVTLSCRAEEDWALQLEYSDLLTVFLEAAALGGIPDSFGGGLGSRITPEDADLAHFDDEIDRREHDADQPRLWAG